jgi:hypothetical protein
VPRGLDQIPASLGSDASVQICVFIDLRRIFQPLPITPEAPARNILIPSL